MVHARVSFGPEVKNVINLRALYPSIISLFRPGSFKPMVSRNSLCSDVSKSDNWLSISADIFIFLKPLSFK
jgi:hypothetical protein